jgi:exosortase
LGLPGSRERQLKLGAWCAVLAGVFLWSYWSTLGELVSAWNDNPDYSHGFLVAPLAAFFLWASRDRLPRPARHVVWWGIALLALSVVLRAGASYYYLTQVDAWSIPLWIAGVIWVFAGWQVARWSLPAVLFLYFMVPLPYRMEHLLSLPLQTIATRLSAWTLQCLGQAAVVEGHTIHLGAHRLEVEQACSGLRMLVGVAALAVAYTLLVRQSWLERVLLLASVIPVALAANVARIAITGLLYQYVSSEAGQRFAHDFAGWTMIVLAVALFAGMLTYLRRLLPEREIIEMADLLPSHDTAVPKIKPR